MLDMLGKNYLVEHVAAIFKERQQLKAWRRYIANGVQTLTRNTATWRGAEFLSVSYSDIISPKPAELQKTGDEVALDIIKRMGLKAKGVS